MSVSVCVQMPPAAYNPYPLQLAFSIGGATSGSGTELRKRTTSFSCPSTGSGSRPRKRLHRTESVVDLTLLARDAACPPLASTNNATPLTTPPPVPYTRTLKFYKEQKERRRAVMRRETLCTPVPVPVDSPSVRWHIPTPAPVCDPVSPSPNSARLPPTSPLAHCELSLSSDSAQPLARALVLPPPPSSQSACGPAHPPPPCARARSKSKSKAKAPADLHRRALTACMRASPAGAKILHMGARLAVGIMAATRELEQMCDGDGEEDGMNENEVEEEDVVAADADVPMPDADSDADADSEPELEPEPAMSASWVVVGERPAVACGREIMREYGVTRERDDWEMVAVECVA
ncbi:hypothetical protein GGX14DRAFT_433781 [Mycena pura]|uniref:Uncharacterized protein n=1 Tax=Mycena pura TaxID=153505 RepID=A0AAD6VQW4_9AGAR|nr:hypothetical protein GGX14DRAFT_433781 [Mycena pura]